MPQFPPSTHLLTKYPKLQTKITWIEIINNSDTTETFEALQSNVAALDEKVNATPNAEEVQADKSSDESESTVHDENPEGDDNSAGVKEVSTELEPVASFKNDVEEFKKPLKPLLLLPLQDLL